MKVFINHLLIAVTSSLLVAACVTSRHVESDQAEKAEVSRVMREESTEPQLGEKGPGGGIIFYDDQIGFDFDGDGRIADDEKNLLEYGYLRGFRFLEAAPRGWNLPETRDDPSAFWGGDEYNIGEIDDVEINLVNPEPENLKMTLGNGKRNTELILQSLAERTRETGTAAHLCVAYQGGGFDDWFLPSVGELVVLHGMRELVGGVSMDGYNSSSESRFNNLRWVVNMREDTFGVDTIRKYHERRVRPIRAF
jgi:hypothetical protein